MRFKQPELRKPRIEIVPMIDTIFFLLVFFMVTWVSIVKLSGIDLNVPRTNMSQQMPQTSPVLSLSPNGLYYLNGVPTTATDWPGLVRNQLLAHPQTNIVLNVAPNQKAQTLISVLDELNAVVGSIHSQARIVVATKRVTD